MGALSSRQVKCFPCINLFALYISCTHSRILARLANDFVCHTTLNKVYLILSYLISSHLSHLIHLISSHLIVTDQAAIANTLATALMEAIFLRKLQLWTVHILKRSPF